MDPPPDYKEVVTEMTNAVPSAPSYARVFQQTAQQASALFGELEWKEIGQEKRRHFPENEGETSDISSSVRPSESVKMGPGGQLFNREMIMNQLQDFEAGKKTIGSKKTRSSHKQKPTELDVRYLESGQKMFSNRVAIHGNSEQFQDEEEDCNTVVGKQSFSRQAVSIPQKSAFVVKSSQNETVLNQAQMGRYFYRFSSKEEQQRMSFDQENGEKVQENRVVIVQPVSGSFVEQSPLRSQRNKSPVRSQSLSPGSSNYANYEKRRESYIYSETRDVGVQAEAGRTTAKRTYCFVNICFCMSCRCALCSTSCRCTWLHCVPCLAYSVLCCPFWFVCLFCSFINPCWKEILLVTSGALKHLAFSCRKSVAGNNCSFTCLADDVEETLWDSRRWGCGFEEAEEI